MNFNYFLETPKKGQSKTDERSIRLYILLRPKAKPIKVSTGLRIYPGKEFWNSEAANSKKVRENITTKRIHGVNKKGQLGSDLQEKLDKLSDYIKTTYNNCIAKGLDVVETEKEIREAIKDFEKPREEKVSGFIPFVSKIISEGKILSGKKKGLSLSEPSIVVYKRTLKLLVEFKENIDFDDFTNEFYSDFQDHLLKIKVMGKGTVGKHIKTLKTFLYAANRVDLSNINSHHRDKVSVWSDETTSIYLTGAELSIIYNLDLSNNKRLENARDLFLIGAYTALRFSDFSRLSDANINNGIIAIRTKKTDTMVHIPIGQRVMEIMEKHKGLPRTISNVKLNEYIKEIGKLAGIDNWEVITPTPQQHQHLINKYAATGEYLPEQKIIKKYLLIGTHTARRSAATNMYKYGIPAISIMMITGHKTERAFLGYIKVRGEENAEMLKGHSFFTGGEYKAVS